MTKPTPTPTPIMATIVAICPVTTATSNVVNAVQTLGLRGFISSDSSAGSGAALMATIGVSSKAVTVFIEMLHLSDSGPPIVTPRWSRPHWPRVSPQTGKQHSCYSTHGKTCGNGTLSHNSIGDQIGMGQ